MEASAHWRSSSTTTTWRSADSASSHRTVASSSSNRRRSGSSALSGAGPSARTRSASRSRSRPAGSSGRVEADRAGEIVEGLHPGPEPRRTLAVPAGPPPHERVGVGVSGGLHRGANERGLAHAGLAADEHRRTAAGRRGLRRLCQPMQGLGPPDDPRRLRSSHRVLSETLGRSPDRIWRKPSVSGASSMTPQPTGGRWR